MSYGAKYEQPISIGHDQKGEEVTWRYPDLNNFNGLFIGTSGSGKTHTIRNMLARVFSLGTTFHIIDVKGDFGYSNFETNGLSHLVGPDDVHDVTFSYFEGGSSLNPLQVPRTEEGGGVVMTIESCKSLVKNFNPNMGQKQLGYLGEVLKAVYNDFGISHDDEKSWGLKPPTFQDVFDKMTVIYQSITSSLDSGSVGTIMADIGKSKRKAIKLMRTLEDEEEADQESVRLELHEESEMAASRVASIVRIQLSYDNLHRNGTGEEWEHWSKDSIYGLRDTIGQMVESRLFTGAQSRTRDGKINRYDLTMISPAHQQIMMRIISARVFAMGVMSTKISGLYDPPFASHVLVTDEGKHVKEISKNPLAPVNRIATEGRGFGLGVWMGVQQPDQVTQDLLRNISFYFVLKTPESSSKEMVRMFNVKPNQLKQLIFRENCLYSSSNPYVVVRQFSED
tara:strand:+ start:5118 stop:6473 length:1356 start_codon:yes stop_codon:yes gene_type:complete